MITMSGLHCKNQQLMPIFCKYTNKYKSKKCYYYVCYDQRISHCKYINVGLIRASYIIRKDIGSAGPGS